jgi:anti-sigma-K factor RskA
MNAEIHTLTGAYALDALSEAEREGFEHHLAECESCTAEVAELQATSTRLGMAVAVTPPPAMKAQVLAAARRVRQLPPSGPLVDLAGPVQDHRPSGTGHSTDHGPAVRGSGPGDSGTVRFLRRRWSTWAPALAAAACLVVAVVFGVQSFSAQRESQQAQEQLDLVMTVLSAPDARIATASSGDSRATAVVSQSQGKIAFMARDMPPLPEDRSYQVWSIGPTGMHSVGVMASGAEPAPVLGDLADGRSVGVTIEPLGGSTTPSADPIMEFALPT